MTRAIKAAGFGAALLVAALFGAVALGTAEAQLAPIPTGDDVPSSEPLRIPPAFCDGRPCSVPWEAPAPANEGRDAEDGAVDFDGEAVVCPVTGCEVPIRFVDEDGNTVAEKLMVITFEDIEGEEPASE